MTDITDAAARLRHMNDALEENDRLRGEIARLRQIEADRQRHEAELDTASYQAEVDYQAEIDRLRLTDAEREAIKTAAACMGLWMIEKGVAADESMRRAATTLRGLLERTK